MGCAQIEQNVSDHLGAMFDFGEIFFDAQFIIARQFDVLVFLHQCDDA
jgi:hypothetical protein